jgi:hypothetical protein
VAGADLPFQVCAPSAQRMQSSQTPRVCASQRKPRAGICHSERSEESPHFARQLPRSFASLRMTRGDVTRRAALCASLRQTCLLTFGLSMVEY